MADPTKTPTGANLGAQAETEDARFYFSTVREFTGLVQVRVGAGAEFMVGDKSYAEGEVFRVGSKAYADSLVASGNHAHAPIGTPIGKPAEPKPTIVAPATHAFDDE